MNNNNDKQLKPLSKFLSFVLRHQPQSIGLQLDAAGWASVDELLQKAQQAGKRLDRALLQRIVDTNDKQRFAFSEDGQRIRANQGHSLDVELALPPSAPPAVLYHGTATRFVASIFATGLDKRNRHHVHLTEDRTIALSVGQRYGLPVLLKIDAEGMVRDGHVFFRSANGVWLTDHVPAAYLERAQ